jgi:Protein of unknown function (DUF2842)
MYVPLRCTCAWEGPSALAHRQEAVIRPRVRKLIGTIALLALVAVWSLLAMALAQVVLVRQNGLLDFAYYVVAGLGWVPLAMLLVSWMSRGDGPRRKR